MRRDEVNQPVAKAVYAIAQYVIVTIGVNECLQMMKRDGYTQIFLMLGLQQLSYIVMLPFISRLSTRYATCRTFANCPPAFTRLHIQGAICALGTCMNIAVARIIQMTYFMSTIDTVRSLNVPVAFLIELTLGVTTLAETPKLKVVSMMLMLQAFVYLLTALGESGSAIQGLLLSITTSFVSPLATHLSKRQLQYYNNNAVHMMYHMAYVIAPMFLAMAYLGGEWSRPMMGKTDVTYDGLGEWFLAYPCHILSFFVMIICGGFLTNYTTLVLSKSVTITAYSVTGQAQSIFHSVVSKFFIEPPDQSTAGLYAMIYKILGSGIYALSSYFMDNERKEAGTVATNTKGEMVLQYGTDTDGKTNL